MKRTNVLGFLLLLSFIIHVPAQVPDVEQNLRRHVEYLASAKLEGRRTGDPGATAAANYVARQFKNSRLKPGLRASFLQPFPYVAGVTLGSDNQLHITPTDRPKEIGIHWMPLGYSPNADIPETGIVFAGFGVSATDAKYDDYLGVDVRDKIVVMFDSVPDKGNPHSAFARFNIHTKANIAKEKGAKAIILIAADPDFRNDRLAKLSYNRTLGETALPVVGIARSHAAELLGAVDDKGLTSIEIFFSNKATSPPNAGGETWKAASNPVNVEATGRIKISLAKKTVDAYNVIGMLPGTDPQLKSEAIIIGAHYDHLGHGGTSSLAANSSDIHYGADDNASGTSAVLELARQFARERKNKRTLIFMAFGGEEEGLLGSKHYVNNPVWPLERTVAMINLDMVGRLNENKLTIGGVGTASEWRTLVMETAINQPMRLEGNAKQKALNESKHDSTRRLGPGTFTVLSSVSPANRSFDLQLNDDGFGPSDHSSFYSKNIPVLFFFTGTHVDYHKPSDTFDKINYNGLTKIVDYVGEIVKSIDGTSRKPTYAVAKSSAPMGQVRLTVSLGTIPSYGDTTDGMVLDGVRDNSPAAKAGLKAGDKITKLAGKDVRNAMDYTYVLSSMKPGEEYEVELIRGTERMTLKIIPAAAARRP